MKMKLKEIDNNFLIVDRYRKKGFPSIKLVDLNTNDWLTITIND